MGWRDAPVEGGDQKPAWQSAPVVAKASDDRARRPRTKAETDAARTVAKADKRRGGARSRALADSYMFGFTDEIEGAGAALKTGALNLLGRGPGYSAGDAYQATSEASRNALAEYRREKPVEATGNLLFGAVANPLNVVGGGFINGVRGGAQVARAGAGGAGIGALSGAGGGTDAASRFQGAAVGGALGGAMGAAFQYGGNALGAMASNARSTATPGRRLAAEGVQLTPGQMAGGLAKNAEDLALRAPILGPAIGNARRRGVETLSTAQGNRALREIGQTVPKGVKPGNETVEFVSQRIGQQYDDAAALVTTAPVDTQFQQSLHAIRSAASELGDDARAQFDNIVRNRIEGRIASGPLDGQAIRQMQKEISGLAAKFGSSSDASQQLLGDHLDDLSVALGDLLGRNSPQAAKLIKEANAGWRNFVVMRNAAARNIEDGVPTPGQLGMAVKASDRSVGKGAVARGAATMQDLAADAKAVMPDQFGNPGTANAVGLGGLGVGLLTEPATAVGIGAGLAGSSLLYSRPVITAINAVYQASTPAQATAALGRLAEMAAQNPGLAQVYDEIAAQLAGRADGQPISPQPSQ